jgi:ribosome-binding protein aMBF1 (putative translation factor)
MPELKPKSRKNKRAKAREFVFSTLEKKLLKSIGLRIQKELHDQKKSLEWLAFTIGISRSALQEIVAGRSNIKILTLSAIATGLGYKDVRDLLG